MEDFVDLVAWLIAISYLIVIFYRFEFQATHKKFLYEFSDGVEYMAYKKWQRTLPFWKRNMRTIDKRFLDTSILDEDKIKAFKLWEKKKPFLQRRKIFEPYEEVDLSILNKRN